MARLTDDAVHAWVAESCHAQHLPVHVTDPLVIEQVRVLLTGQPKPDNATRPGRAARASAPARDGSRLSDLRRTE
jgi:hypothetical protein